MSVFGLKVICDFAVELHLLLGELDVGVEGALLVRLLGQLVQLRHDLFGVRALDALEGLLADLRAQLARPPHSILEHADALQLLRLHRAKIL